MNKMWSMDDTDAVKQEGRDRSRPLALPTIAEVAAAAGVGRATAARTLGNYGSVSPSVRARVLAAAEELRYRPNSLARSMTTGITQTLGVIVADIGNPFFAGVIRGISDTCDANGYAVIVLSTDEKLTLEKAAIGVLMDKQVDGIIIASAATRVEEVSHIQDALNRSIPIVLLDRLVKGLDLDSIVIDNRDASKAAVNTLIARGHRRIGFVWGPATEKPAVNLDDMLRLSEEAIWSDGERLRGYLDALADAGVEFDTALVTHSLRNESETARAVAKMLRLDDPATAVFATETDAMVGTLSAIRKVGMSYPRDVSLIGFDDSSWAHVMDPPLTMVQQPMLQLGEAAAAQLLNRIEGDKSAPMVNTLPARFIERLSVAIPNRYNEALKEVDTGINLS